MRGILLLLFLSYCVTVDESIDGKAKSIQFNVCFWRAEKLNSKILNDTKNLLVTLGSNCDSISFTEIKADNEGLPNELENIFSKLGYNYTCLDSFHDEKTHLTHTKYITCANNNKVVEIKPFEYADTRRDFSSPPTFFFLELTNGTKANILPFHAHAGNKNELIDFERVVNFSFQQFSERKTFLGGDFYTDKKYHSESFLKSLLYFQILKNLILEPTTISGEKNDILMTDKITALNCKGNTLIKYSSSSPVSKELELVSNHFPIIAQCKLK